MYLGDDYTLREVAAFISGMGISGEDSPQNYSVMGRFSAFVARVMEIEVSDWKHSIDEALPGHTDQEKVASLARLFTKFLKYAFEESDKQCSLCFSETEVTITHSPEGHAGIYCGKCRERVGMAY